MLSEGVFRKVCEKADKTEQKSLSEPPHFWAGCIDKNTKNRGEIGGSWNHGGESGTFVQIMQFSAVVFG